MILLKKDQNLEQNLKDKDSKRETKLKIKGKNHFSFK